MKLSAPTKLFFLISLVFFIIGALGTFGVWQVPYIAKWDYFIAWLVLAAGCLFKGV